MCGLNTAAMAQVQQPRALPGVPVATVRSNGHHLTRATSASAGQAAFLAGSQQEPHTNEHLLRVVASCINTVDAAADAPVNQGASKETFDI